MKAGIIAAGEGSRLRSEGITEPKPLVPVNGVPLIERLILSFSRCGISDVVCIINESSIEVKEFAETKRFPIPVSFIVKTTASSMHSLFALAPHLIGEKFLLSTVDSVFSEDEFERFMRHARSPDAAALDGLLAVTDFVDDENPLTVRIDGSKRILAFGKEPGASEPIAAPRGLQLVTGGLYVLSPRIFRETDAALERGVRRLRNFLAYLLERGYSLGAYPFSKIIDLDHANDIRAAEALLRGQ